MYTPRRNAHAPLSEPPPTPGMSPRREVRVDELLRGARELVIRHGHSEYRRRLTRNDKLILTK